MPAPPSRPRRRLQLVRAQLCGGGGGGGGNAGPSGGSTTDVAAAYARAGLFTNVAALNQRINTGEATPHWGAGGQLWWLRRWTEPCGGAAKQFMALAHGDTRPVPAPAFDHTRLADGLVAAGLVAARPEPWALPFSALTTAELSGDAPHATFALSGGGQRCRCDLLSYSCEPLPPDPHRPIDAGVASPDGAHVAFVRDHNLWLRSVATGAEAPLSHDGRAGYSYATALPSPVSMVVQLTQNPAQRPQLAWSPDSAMIATFALEVPAETQLLSMAQNAPPDRYRPRHYVFSYPLPVDSRLPVSVVKLFDIATASLLPVQPAAHDALPGGCKSGTVALSPRSWVHGWAHSCHPPRPGALLRPN